MDLPNVSQPLAGHGNIRHRGQLEQYEAARRKQFRQQSQHVRPAILDQEHLLPVFRPPGRVQVDHVRLKTVQHLLHLPGFHHFIPEPHVTNAQLLEIQFRRFRQLSLHLVIQNLSRHLRERPCIHAHAAGQVGDPEDSFASLGMTKRASLGMTRGVLFGMTRGIDVVGGSGGGGIPKPVPTLGHIRGRGPKPVLGGVAQRRFGDPTAPGNQ